MEFGGGDDGEHFRDDPEWLRRLAETHRLVGSVLCREAEPDVLILDRSSQPPHIFELAYGELDEAPPPSSSPLIDYDINDRDSYANMLVESANYMMDEFLDAWAANAELEDRVLRHVELSDAPDFHYAVARRNAYFNDVSETANLAFHVWSIDLIGGNLDGVSIDRMSIKSHDVNSHDDCAHLIIITNNDEVCFSYIHDRNQHPLVRECIDFFGTSTNIIRILAGAFDDEDHLDTVLEIVADGARGLVPEDESIILLQRVRVAALLAKERQALAYTRPTLEQIDMMTGFLRAVQAPQ